MVVMHHLPAPTGFSQESPGPIIHQALLIDNSLYSVSITFKYHLEAWYTKYVQESWNKGNWTCCLRIFTDYIPHSVQWRWAGNWPMKQVQYTKDIFSLAGSTAAVWHQYMFFQSGFAQVYSKGALLASVKQPQTMTFSPEEQPTVLNK